MFQLVHNSLAVEAQWLFESDIMTSSAYDKLAQRGDIRIVRRGCYGRTALVDYESMPDRFKRKIMETTGNPYDRYFADRNELTEFLRYDPTLRQALEEITVSGCGRHLPTKMVERHHAEACILTAISEYLIHARMRSAQNGRRPANNWAEVSAMVAKLDVRLWPHRLPRNARSLERKWQAFNKDGFSTLLSNKWGNNNAAKVENVETKDKLMLALTSDPRNLANTQVAELYNAEADKRLWSRITPAMVASYRLRHANDIAPRRRGAKEYHNTRSMQVKRRAPAHPLCFWTLDGWDAELLYQETGTDRHGHSRTTYANRVVLEVVLDACTKYPIGYAIGQVENADLIREALADAVRHTEELFGRKMGTYQLQMDNFGGNDIKHVYEGVARVVTPAAPGNAKAKIIEPWFRYFNHTYCQTQANWNGYGITASKQSQPNTELLNKKKRDFPGYDGVCQQIDTFIRMERERLRDEFQKRFESLPEEWKVPISEARFLELFGRTCNTRQGGYLMRPEGIVLTIGGHKRTYDCFDLDFRRHEAVRWTILADTKDFTRVLAKNEDGSLRFMLEEKYEQPMALCERTEGDAKQLERVRDFNRRMEASIAERIGKIADDVTPLLATDIEEAEDRAIAARRAEVLGKRLLTDSRGQHKTPLREAEMAANGTLPLPDSELYDLY